MRLRSLMAKLAGYSRRSAAAPPPALAPLIDPDGLRELARCARSLPWSLLTFERPASHPLLGETLSLYRGRGLEFEENRGYQAGDEPRLLNWWLYARTGALYTKVFSEERRPQVFLLIDRRAAMRFATRGQLKVALAAQIAACYACQAQQQALPVGGLILNRTADWLAPALGEVALQNLLESLAAPCPPLPFADDQLDLGESLQLLLHRLPGGSFIVLISDFADLEADSAMPLLSELSARHSLRAVQILDPVELRLPATGEFLIEDGAAGQPLRIDGRDELQQARYAQAVAERQAQLAACFERCGIPFRRCTTESDLQRCLGQPDSGGNGHE